MLEKFKKALDNKSKFGALLTDSSKAFVCLNHELLIAKLDTYGFDHSSFQVILNYLSNRKHRTKINNIFSDWADITSGIPRGFILYIQNIYKISKVIPIHKNGDTSDLNNYRPISLLSIFNKIMEKLMHKQLYDFLQEHNILFQNQFGFRKNNSTTFALLQITEKIKVTIDNKKYGMWYLHRS